jgi:uncharacterized repeat protein (TIGR01451 family)
MSPNPFPRLRFAAGVLALVSLLTAVSADAGAQDVVEFTVQYSLDGEIFQDTLPAAPGQSVVIRIEIDVIQRGGAGLMDIMGEDDLDFSFFRENIIFFGFAGQQDGPCFVVVDEDLEILKVRCPFCDILPGEPGIMQFTATIRDDAPRNATPTQVISLLELSEGEKGDPRPCTTEGPEPIGTIQENEIPPEEGGVVVLSPAISCVKEVSLDGGAFLPTVLAEPGQEVFYRVRIRNVGNADLFGASFADELPEGLGNVELLPPVPGSCAAGGSEIACDSLGPLAPDDTIEILYKGTVTANDGVLTNTAVAIGSPGTPDNPGAEVSAASGATLIVGADAIPTLGEWGILVMIALFGGVFYLHRRAG